MENKDKIINLFSKYITNQATIAEVEELLTYIRSSEEHDYIARLIEQSMFSVPNQGQDKDREQRLADTRAMLLQHIGETKAKPAKKLYLWTSLASAAIVLIISLLAWYVFTKKDFGLKKNVLELAQHVSPGHNRATLILSNGKQLDLDNINAGTIASESGIEIMKAKSGELVYTVTGSQNTSKFNTLETPKGGQYQVSLPDGTKVWLNAASSLKYSASLGVSERRVELNGEAYFEVAKDKLHPFIVKTATQEVTVLGTHFNINSYANEPNTVTTLQEGHVQVSSGGMAMKLMPGEKMVTKSKGNMEVQLADVETTLAWKNGAIKFKDADIETIMRQVSRWYNIEVSYGGTIPHRTFNGGISRQSNLAALLKLLSLSNINFEINERPDGTKNLIVRP